MAENVRPLLVGARHALTVCRAQPHEDPGKMVSTAIRQVLNRGSDRTFDNHGIRAQPIDIEDEAPMLVVGVTNSVQFRDLQDAVHLRVQKVDPLKDILLIRLEGDKEAFHLGFTLPRHLVGYQNEL